MSRQLWPGTPFPLGATCDPDGTNFALFSEHAQRVELCLFDDDGKEERVELVERTALNWHGYLPDVHPGQRYAYRVHGDWAPEQGRRFNAAKLLLVPYAKAIDGAIDAGDTSTLPYTPNGDDADLHVNTVDDAEAMPKCVVVDEAFD